MDYSAKKIKNEMEIFLKAKELISNTYLVTETWPKKYRFDFTQRLRNSCLSVYELIIEANEVYIDTKLIDDLRKSIDHWKNEITKNPDNNNYFLQNKLLMLQITKANKLDERINKRRDKQDKAFAELKKIDFYYSEAFSMKLINVKKWEFLSCLINDLNNLLKAWISSDRKRFKY